MISYRFIHSSLFTAGAVLVAASAHADPAAAQAPAPAAASGAKTTAMASQPEPAQGPTGARPAPDTVAPAPPPDQTTAFPPSATMQGALSALGGVGYGWGLGVGFGIGARFQYDFLPKGVLHLPGGKHDEMGLEAGLDYFHVSYGYADGYTENYNEVTPLIGWVWNFWLTDNLAVYPKLDVGFRIESFSVSDSAGHTVSTAHSDVFPVYFEGAAGVVYKIGPVALRGEVGWEALRVGAGINVL